MAGALLNHHELLQTDRNIAGAEGANALTAVADDNQLVPRHDSNLTRGEEGRGGGPGPAPAEAVVPPQHVSAAAELEEGSSVEAEKDRAILRYQRRAGDPAVEVDYLDGTTAGCRHQVQVAREKRCDDEGVANDSRRGETHLLPPVFESKQKHAPASASDDDAVHTNREAPSEEGTGEER
eukprot:766763-Hanusia_phi.AAC.2